MVAKPVDNNGGTLPPQKPDITELVSSGDVCLKPSDEPETGPTTSFMDKVARLLKKCADTRPRTEVALFSDHKEAYYRWKDSQKRGELSKHSVLIHVDTHADMGTFSLNLPPPPEDSASIEEFKRYALTTTDIGDFIPPAVFEGLVDEIYYVRPNWINPKNHNNKKDSLEVSMLNNRDITYYVGKQNGKIYFSPDRPENMEGIREIVVHRIYKEDLPDFRNEKRDVILDLDLDWADNSGLGTKGDTPSPGSTADATSRIGALAKTLSNKHIKPKVVTIAGSPNFTRTRRTDDLATAALREFVKSGVLQTAEVSLGRYTPSINTTCLALIIINCLIDNISNDPRLLGDRLINVRSFNAQKITTSMDSIPENLLSGIETDFSYHQLRWYYQTQQNYDVHSPDEDIDKLFNFVHRRDDFRRFIELSDEYGLLNLSDALKQLATLQQKSDTTRSELFKVYIDVLKLLRQSLPPDLSAALELLIPRIEP